MQNISKKWWTIVAIVSLFFYGCEWKETEHTQNSQKSFPITLQGVFLEEKNIISSSFSLKFNNEIILPLQEASTVSFKDIHASEVALQGIFIPHKQKQLSSFTVVDIRPISYNWIDKSFPSQNISLSLPPFIEAVEKLDTQTISFVNNHKEAAQLVPYEIKTPDEINSIEIKIGKKSAFRLIKENDVYIILPEIKKALIVISASEDLSLWYNIAESIDSSDPLDVNQNNISMSQETTENNQWEEMYIMILDIIENCEAYTNDDSCQINSISLSNEWIDLVYFTKTNPKLRSIIERRTKKNIAIFKHLPESKDTWRLISGKIPSENPLASWQSISSKNINKLPYEMQWIFSDEYGFQIAYPENMYYIFSKPERKIWWHSQGYGPRKNGNPSYIELEIIENSKKLCKNISSNAVIVYESGIFCYILSYSDDISKNTIQTMSQSFVPY